MKPRTPRLIGLPYDGASSYLEGAATAPPLIRAALRSPAGNSWTENLKDITAAGGLSDAGDLSLDGAADPQPRIEKAIAQMLSDGFRPLALGGDHSITCPIVRAVRQFHSKLSILHIDAHPDLYDSFEGNRFSHACPFARIMEEQLADRLVQVGIRASTGHLREQAARFNVETIDMHDWIRDIEPYVEGDVYISLDLDALDPAFAPGVSHREPGGLSVRDVIDIIQNLAGTLVGADVVEYNPCQDVAGLTAGVAAKLVKELAGKMMR